ncbi:MAG: hypothetical protein GY940_40755, partial [bacterium]|nr:hypothetical protein [bacterium]
IDLDLSQYSGHFENSSTESGNDQLWQIVTFTALDGNKQVLSEPLTVVFRNLEHYNAVRTRQIPRMNKKYICSPLGGNWPKSTSRGCINRFDYEGYLSAHTNWLKALDYSRWSNDDKKIFYGFLERLEKTGLLDFDNVDQRMNKSSCHVTFDEKKAKEISLLYAAHSLFMEVNGKLNWTIETMEAELLQTLFHRRSLFWERNARNNQKDYMMFHFINTHPNNIGDWAVKAFMKATPGKTIYALDDWIGKNLIHNYTGANPICLQTFDNFNNTSKKITKGCSATSNYMVAIARSLNIPAQVINFKHTGLYFPTLGKGMAHADDAYDHPLFSLDSPFTDNLAGLRSAALYYRSFNPPGSYYKPALQTAKFRNLDKRFDDSWSTYNRKISYLHLTPRSHFLTFTCRGYNDIKKFMGLYINAYGEPAFKRLFCCSLDYMPKYFKYLQNNCKPQVEADRKTYNCAQLTQPQGTCYDVRFLPVFKLNMFPKNSAEEKKFLAGSEVPQDFLTVLRNNPNFVPTINDGISVDPWETDQYRFINRFVLKFKTDTLKPW